MGQPLASISIVCVRPAAGQWQSEGVRARHPREALNQKGEGELQVALPAIGILGILHPLPVPILKSLALSARLKGGTIGDAGTFIDADGGVEWPPLPVLALRLGYRYFHAEGRTTETRRTST